MIATDLDGTLLHGDGTIDARTRRAIAALQDAGAEVVVCTARPARWVGDLAREGGLRGPAVCANGAVIWDLAAQALMGTFPIDPEVARSVVAALRPLLPGAAWAVEGAESFAHEPDYFARWPVPEDTIVAHVDALLAAPPVKLLARGPGESPDALVARVRSAVAGLVEVTHSSTMDTLLEMSAAGVSKASGLAALCERRGIDRSEVVAFGDMPNDVAMLRWAGRGIAVANAHPDVLGAADEVTASNEESGVAAVLETLVDSLEP